LLSQVLCNMAGLVGLNDVRAAVKAAVGTRNKTWKDSMWSAFIKDVVSFLVDEKSEDPDNVVEAAVGLTVYGATTQEKLQGVAGQPPDDEKFTRKLGEEGVPKAICDMLFDEYVANARQVRSKFEVLPLSLFEGCFDPASSPYNKVEWPFDFVETTEYGAVVARLNGVIDTFVRGPGEDTMFQYPVVDGASGSSKSRL
jgi:hypothetical protein